jgi:hypothetical protein
MAQTGSNHQYWFKPIQTIDGSNRFKPSMSAGLNQCGWSQLKTGNSLS